MWLDDVVSSLDTCWTHLGKSTHHCHEQVGSYFINSSFILQFVRTLVCVFAQMCVWFMLLRSRGDGRMKRGMRAVRGLKKREVSCQCTGVAAEDVMEKSLKINMKHRKCSQLSLIAFLSLCVCMHTSVCVHACECENSL